MKASVKGKECRYCSEYKPISCFTKNSRASDGHCNFCKYCLAGYRSYLRYKRSNAKISEYNEVLKVVEGNFDVSFH